MELNELNFTLSEFREKYGDKLPNIQIPNDGYKYTVVIYDPDTLYGNYLHYLKIDNNIVSVNYIPPNPPSGKHRYYINIYRQTKEIYPYSYQRQNFDISSFVSDNGLQLYKYYMFTVQK